ncbi:retrotransposon ORF1 [Tanacetum coccineum]
MGKSNRNKRKQLEKYQLIYSDIRPSMSTETPLTQEEAKREALAIIQEELDEICLDKMKLDGMNKEEEEAIIKIKGEALIEKDDPGAFVIPIRLEGKINLNALVDTSSDVNVIPYHIYKELGREEVQNVKKGISMLDHSKVEPMGLLSNVLCQVGVTTIIAKFLILDMPIDRNTLILVGRGFLHTCGGILNTIDNITSTFDGICHQTFRAAKTSLDTAESDSDDEKEYLNCNDPLDRSLALQDVMNPFRKICVWKKVVSFLGSLSVALQHVEWKPDYTRCFNKKEDSDGQWHAEIRLTEPYGNIYDQGWNYKEIFTSVAWIRAFNINEPIYSEFCHEFYSTYEFDEVCADDELKTKKIIKFRLGGCAHSLTLLEFPRRLGLYHAEELDEEGFDVYFQGGLRSDEHFNAQEYWLSISQEENLSLSRSQASTIRNPVLRVLHKMITYGLCQRTTGYDKIQKNDLWLLSMFDARHQNRKARVLSDEVIRSLSAPICCRDLDTTTLRELIDFEGRLIPEDPQPDVPRVAIPRAQRASMQDLYERMGSMEILQGAIERMDYRQSYL